MGVSLCTGPNCERGVRDCNAPCELQYLRSNSMNLQVSASAEAPALEEYKYSASVQSLLLLLRLVMIST